MRVSHAGPALSHSFDDPNLVSCAGLAPVMALAQRCGLHTLTASTLTLKTAGGVHAPIKVGCLVGGMVAGADSIADMDLLRHGGMRRLFTDLRAPSTLGTFLRTFTFGHVRQLDAVAARLLPRLARVCPLLLPGADQVCYVDIDDTVRQVHGYAKQGVGYGYSGVKGLNALVATASTPLGAPVILATRLRKGSVNSARGAARLVTDALVTVRAAGAGGPHGASGSTGLVLLRADSAFFTRDVLAAAGRAGARFSVTARMNPSVVAAISQIEPTAWTAIRYPNAIYDEDERRWISDAEVAEIPFTAFTSRRKAQHLTGRLIVRRVKRLNPRSRSTTGAAGAEQGELFAAYRHHAVFTDSQLSMLTAERTHRAHAIIEQSPT